MLEEKIEKTLLLIEQKEPEIQALLPEDGRRERLFAEARALQKQDLPLLGMLLGVKDLFCAQGFETRAGSALPPELFRGAEAPAVSALKKAGALVLGKTVTTEFAYFEPGPTRNPRNLTHTPGGSSSGSAAAVAAGYCDVALGTQTIGSISRPASYCGVVGFKPTYGRVSCAGVVPFSPSVDHVGFFVPHSGAVAPVAQVLCANWNGQKIEGKPVLGVPVGPYLEQAVPENLASYRAALKILEKAGYPVVEVSVLQDIDAINALHRRLIAAEFYKVHESWFAQYEHLYRPKSRELFLTGKEISAAELKAGIENRALLRAKLASHAIDLWIMPSTIDAAPAGIAVTGSPFMNLPWTHAGLPTLSLPFGKSKISLPFGLQLAGKWMEDEALVEWAEAVEKVLKFTSRHSEHNNHQ